MLSAELFEDRMRYVGHKKHHVLLSRVGWPSSRIDMWYKLNLRVTEERKSIAWLIWEHSSVHQNNELIWLLSMNTHTFSPPVLGPWPGIASKWGTLPTGGNVLVFGMAQLKDRPVILALSENIWWNNQRTHVLYESYSPPPRKAKLVSIGRSQHFALCHLPGSGPVGRPLMSETYWMAIMGFSKRHWEWYVPLHALLFVS